MWLIYCFIFTDDVAEAYNLIKDLEPTTPQEYILKGVVNAALGQEQGSVRLIYQLCVLFITVLMMLVFHKLTCIITIITLFIDYEISKVLCNCSLKFIDKLFVDECLNEPPRGKTNNVVSEQVPHKPACTSTERS